MNSDFMNKREIVHNGTMEFSVRRKTSRNVLKEKIKIGKTITS
jgi:hypothetical protein